LQGGFTVPPSARFLKPPFSSRTVGFPESGWRPWPFPGRPSQYHRGLSAGSHTPLKASVCLPARHALDHTASIRHCVLPRLLFMPAMCREPLCSFGVLLRQMWSLSPHRKTFLFLHRSYGLMRQTKILRSPSASASVNRSLQVATRPCWILALPDVISVNPSQRARPLTPVDSHGALARFFPWQHRPSHSSRWSAFPRLSIQQLQYGGCFRSRRHSFRFRPAALLATRVAPTHGNRREQR
jgi:hypothetical protein